MQQTFNNKRVTVMGLGRFGGGVGVTRFLCQRGAQVLVTDLATPEQLQQSMDQLKDCAVTYRLGEHRIEDFTSADLVVINPAVDVRNNEYVRAAKDAHVPLTSETRLLIAHLPDRERTIGITGSAGKSTTTAMVGTILQRVLGDEQVHVGGNLGGSLLAQIERIKPTDWVVLELSSFMLEAMAEDRWSPHVAVITNLSPNHLDRHGTMEQYAAAKQQILEHQTPKDFAILGEHCEGVFKPQTTRLRWLDGLHTFVTMPPLDLLVPGKHNQHNAMLAIEACAAVGVDRFEAAQALQSFGGLPHRLQLAAEHAGVRYYNDSKATTPEATLLALHSFPAEMVHVILGGYDKGSDMAGLVHAAAAHCKGIYTIGHTGDAIAQLAENTGHKKAAVVRSGTLDQAMHHIHEQVQSGDVVLLSTASASWDQFENYEQRGKAFVEAILKYTGEGINPGA